MEVNTYLIIVPVFDSILDQECSLSSLVSRTWRWKKTAKKKWPRESLEKLKRTKGWTTRALLAPRISRGHLFP